MVLFVAEIGSNHVGNPAVAHEMIRQAKLAGASIAKFQAGWPNDDTLRHIDDWIPDLVRWCNYYDIEFMVSVWSKEGYEATKKAGLFRYKLAHQMKDNAELIALVNAAFVSGHPTSENYFGIYVPEGRYPAYPGDIDMPMEFRDENGWYYGYSSHTPGISDAVLAVSRGAQYIEKHVSLNKLAPMPRDHAFSLSFDEFRQMVDVCEPLGRLVAS